MSLKQVCKEQLKRLPANLPNGPESDTDRRCYLEAFERHARSETHATRVIDSLIETSMFYPKIPELVAACEYIAGDAVPGGCPVCRDEPWVTGEREVRGEKVTAAGRCNCDRGRYFAARDAERKQPGSDRSGMRTAAEVAR